MGSERDTKAIVVFSIGLVITILLHASLWIYYIYQEFNALLLIFNIIFEIAFILVSIFLLISYEGLKTQSVKDSMTQIYNWKYIKDSITTEIERFKRNKKRFGIIYFDIDDFKALNAEYGHYSGDQCLLEVVEVVKSIIRPYDIFGRMGGEEFCIILPEIDQGAVTTIAERIRSKIELTRINRKIPLTVSIGVTLVREEDTYYSVYNRVDEKMSEAKESGKNKVLFD